MGFSVNMNSVKIGIGSSLTLNYLLSCTWSHYINFDNFNTFFLQLPEAYCQIFPIFLWHFVNKLLLKPMSKVVRKGVAENLLLETADI